ncbi:hypothetical protein INS49_012021 [Diaporthe citri]|uniref:uncharacterized protein n=1 Tax=Diaporthe citri TaxID=83186 RepID=UPI001C807691|nr:uncharacterized protein INS49_012021 [Diaporthe citri]KAG6360953.1 hypothetical protein INS49_012021 [Diaporthe citri]
MSNQRGDDLGRPIGELWVELSRDEKKKICDALIDRDQSDVLQHFDTLVRFTRGYLQQQPTGSLPSSSGKLSAPVPLALSYQPSDDRAEERENNEVPVDMSNTPRKKARKVPEKDPTWEPSKRRIAIRIAITPCLYTLTTSRAFSAIISHMTPITPMSTSIAVPGKKGDVRENDAPETK